MRIDPFALLLLSLFSLFFFFFRRWQCRFAEPCLQVSCLELLSPRQESLRARLSRMPEQLLVVSLLLLSLAFLDPAIVLSRAETAKKPASPTPTEGLALYLVLDQSGSMAEGIVVRGRGGHERMSKLELLKRVSRQFVQGDSAIGLDGRPSDLIGLVAFARSAQLLVPLTLDHGAVVDALGGLFPLSDKEQSGTAIGYAIYKTAGLIGATRRWIAEKGGEEAAPYAVKNAVILLVTDGLQAPNPLDVANPFRSIELLEAAKFAKEQGVRLYIINVDPRIASEEFGSYRRVMQQVAQMTEGRFFLVDSSYNLLDIYAEIDQLEKSALPYVAPPVEDPPLFFLSPYLVGFAMALLLLSCFFQTIWIRRVP